MGKNISAWKRLTIFLSLISCGIVFPTAQTANPSPVFVYVKTVAAKISVKSVGQSDWNEIPKFCRVFAGDSLKIPERTMILMGDGSSAWREITGPRTLIVPKQEKSKGNFFKNLFVMFFKEPYRCVSQEGVRNAEALFLAVPDTVFAFALPDTLRWIKNAPWWTTYRVQITHNQETLSDTLVRGNAFRLNASTKRWQQSGNYQIKITLPQSPMLGREADSSVIHVLQESQAVPAKNRLEKLKKRLAQRGRIEDYFELTNFCLTERLHLELEHHLIAMAKKFPDNPEPKIMLYSYYAAFLPEPVAERLAMDRLNEFRDE